MSLGNEETAMKPKYSNNSKSTPALPKVQEVTEKEDANELGNTSLKAGQFEYSERMIKHMSSKGSIENQIEQLYQEYM